MKWKRGKKGRWDEKSWEERRAKGKIWDERKRDKKGEKGKRGGKE